MTDDLAQPAPPLPDEDEAELDVRNDPIPVQPDDPTPEDDPAADHQPATEDRP